MGCGCWCSDGEESGGIVNDINKFGINNINIRASSEAINDKMLKNLKELEFVIKFFCYKSRYEKRHTSKLP